jgi:hypothetical protein
MKKNMKISEFLYTLITVGGFSRGKTIRLDSIRKEYSKPAYAHTMCYNDRFLQFFEKEATSRDFCGPKYPRQIFIDIDGSKGDRESLKSATYEFINDFVHQYGVDVNCIGIYFSGKKGFHIEIPPSLFGIAPGYNVEKSIKALVAHLIDSRRIQAGVDMCIYSSNRMFRLANSVHQDSGLYKIPLKLDELLKLSISQIELLAENPRTSSWMVKGAPVPELVALWEEVQLLSNRSPLKELHLLLQETAFNGSRHNKAFEIARKAKFVGYDENTILTLLLSWNNKNDPPISDDQWFRTMLQGVKVNQNCSSLSPNLLHGLNQIVPVLSVVKKLSDAEFRGFIHLLLLTNTKEKQWCGILIPVGSLVCSYMSLADRSQITINQARRVIKKLITNGYMTKRLLSSNRGQLLSWKGRIRDLYSPENGTIPLNGVDSGARSKVVTPVSSWDSTGKDEEKISAESSGEDDIHNLTPTTI